NVGLTHSRDELERTLARSLLPPLGLNVRRGEAQFLTDPEIEALRELAESRSEWLGYRFVEEALRSPVTTRQLAKRAEPALSAAVGLEPGKRAWVERLLVERLQDPKLDDGQRTDLAMVAAALADLKPEAAAQVAHALIQSMAQTTGDPTQLELVEG